jgi:hypothetical protein
VLDQNPPPDCLKASDQELCSALNDYLTGSTEMLKGINNVDQSEIDAGTTLFDQGNTEINQTTGDMRSATC